MFNSDMLYSNDPSGAARIPCCSYMPAKRAGLERRIKCSAAGCLLLPAVAAADAVDACVGELVVGIGL